MRARDDLRQVAVALRQAGATYDEIALDLGVSKGSCSLWLRGLPGTASAVATPVVVPADGRLARRVRELRQQGALLKDIAAELSCPADEVWRHCQDLPSPVRGRARLSPEQVKQRQREHYDQVLEQREVDRRAVRQRARDGVAALSAREVELVAVTAYWAEGTKSKPWRRQEQLVFTNSDPGLVLVWRAWLDQLGIAEERRTYRVSIHESADPGAAERWWAELLGVPADRFARATLKRHRPLTVRKNVGEDYRGCLVVGVRGSRVLYQQVEGLWQGIVAGLPLRPSSGRDRSPVV